MPVRIARSLAVATAALAAAAPAAQARAHTVDALTHASPQAAALALAAPAPTHARAHARPRAHIAVDAPCAGARADLNGRQLDVARRATLCLLNKIRRAHGLRPLAEDPRLEVAAWRHSRDMVHRRYFDHGDYIGRIASSGYLAGARTWRVGENIAWGGGFRQTPAAIVDMWMHSPPHRHNILTASFRQIGVGVARGTPTGYTGGTYTTDFGAK
jgi:uncharacterized protein YkwD